MLNDSEILEWICNQDRLRIETWQTMHGEQVRVWTIFDHEDEPSGRGDTVREALEMAMQEGA